MNLDPVEYGRLSEKVATLSKDVEDLRGEVHLLNSNLQALVNEMSRGKGMFAGAMAVAMLFGGAVTWVVERVLRA